MPAYVIVFREGPVRDEAAMAEYARKALPSVADFAATPRIVYGAVHALEGAAPDGVVMLEFPTVEEARAWYACPAYQDALPHRKAGADWRVVIVEGL
jgi:uncharacterized protein (DUF1330 family)